MFAKYSTGARKKILLWLSVDATRESEITGEISVYILAAAQVKGRSYIRKTTTDPDSSSYWSSWTHVHLSCIDQPIE